MKLKEFLVKEGFAIGYAEVRRLISSECVSVDGGVARNAEWEIVPNSTIRVGNKVVTYEGRATLEEIGLKPFEGSIAMRSAVMCSGCGFVFEGFTLDMAKDFSYCPHCGMELED